MRLTNDEYGALQQALSDAFVDYADLASAIRRGDFKMRDIASPGRMPDVVREVIDFAESRDSVYALISAARAANSKSIGLMKVAAALGLEPGDPLRGHGPIQEALLRTTQRLERMVDPASGIPDLGSFAAKMQELMRQVCAVEVGDEFGTGFLVGPDKVLTNYHVVKRAIDGNFDSGDIVVRFDYRRLRDRTTVEGGKECHLAQEWLVDHEPYSNVDTLPYEESQAPDEHELDYAILRLAEEVGSQTIPFAAPGTTRGWLVPRRREYEFPTDSFLMVVQHPCHDPIAFDFAKNAVIGMNSNATRVRYRINTLPGSSGSPVLDRNLDLVALHHAGEPGSPDYFLPCKDQLSPANYNEGIPISKILAHVAAKPHLPTAFGVEGDIKDQQATTASDVAPIETIRIGPIAGAQAQVAPGGTKPYVAQGTENVARESPVNAPGPSQQPTRGLVLGNHELNVTGPPKPADALVATASVNVARSSASAANGAMSSMRLAERRTALAVLENLRRLMDEALAKFGRADASGQAIEAAQDLSLEDCIGTVNDLMTDIDLAEPRTTEERKELMDKLHNLIAVVLFGLRLAEEGDAFDVVASLAAQSAAAYGTVGEALGGEQGEVLIRVAPYWLMKAEHAKHRQKMLDEGKKLATASQRPRPFDRQVVGPRDKSYQTQRS